MQITRWFYLPVHIPWLSLTALTADGPDHLLEVDWTKLIKWPEPQPQYDVWCYRWIIENWIWEGPSAVWVVIVKGHPVIRLWFQLCPWDLFGTAVFHASWSFTSISAYNYIYCQNFTDLKINSVLFSDVASFKTSLVTGFCKVTIFFLLRCDRTSTTCISLFVCYNKICFWTEPKPSLSMLPMFD